MINSLSHAQRVQTLRAKAGKRGYAKAVRRWMKRTDSFAERGRLPVNWTPKADDTASPGR